MIFDIGRPLIMAHRGDSSSAPENTLLALEKAVEIGVDVLETDVRMTRDEELVLFHDDTLERTTGWKGTVSDYNLDELMQIDAGYFFTNDGGQTYPFRGQDLRIVTLRKAFERFPNMWFNLDIKNVEPQAPSRLAEIIREYRREDSVIVGSFHSEQVRRFREIAPKVATSANPDEVKRFVMATKLHLGRLVGDIEYQAFQIPVRYGGLTIVTDRFVREAHKRDIAVHVWTINEREEMKDLIRMGVDGIFTDTPEIMRHLLSELDML